jgi:hypothetical protein
MPDLKPEPNAAPVAVPEKSAGPDPLAGLYHMSNTAGVGTQDYVAINPTAIAALLLGFASIAIVLSDVLLVIPLIALVCAIVAMVQIRNSNGTQTGRLLAGLGLALAILVGGGRVAYYSLSAYRVSAAEHQIAQLVHDLGEDIRAHRYPQAYDRFTDDFRERVPFATFEQAFKGLDDERLGGLKSIEWNGQRMVFEDKPDSAAKYAVAMTLFSYQKFPDPQRLLVNFEGTDGHWKILDMAALFPRKK